ncbi:spore germination protein [Brevibacillus ginsengisoli]|uniref:spore germination protein n=1 Tax=Brevibacillus ginsengisoli TaxID=363854 RepID=UPI003CEE67B1
MKGVWQKWQQRKANRREDFLKGHTKKRLDKVPTSPLSPSVDANIADIHRYMGSSDDLIVRHFIIGPVDTGVHAALVFLDTMVDKMTINQFIIEYLASPYNDRFDPAMHNLKKSNDLRHVITDLLSGDAVLFIEGQVEATLCGTIKYAKRSIEEPSTESVVRGPRDGFNESIVDNVSLIRKRLKDPSLRVRLFSIGERTNTALNVVYIEGVAPLHIVQEIIQRIQSIQIDGVLESGYIEQMIQDYAWSPFPQLQTTERPDKVVANLLEGKVAIIVDGTPFVLVAPAIFNQFYQSPEDYYERFLISTFVRIIRLISMAIALLMPSFYIAFSSFHPEMIPSRLVIAMAAGRATVPFPSIIEAFIMEIAIEILREASIRLPGPIGPTIGIVGALVVGQAAVQAGLVSPIMVIIVALTTIGSFASPSYSAAISVRMLRFPMMILAGMFGLYGIMSFLILIAIHLSALTSFGVPYMSPLSPVDLSSMRDYVFRAPFKWMKVRPRMFNSPDPSRQNWGNPNEE